MCEKVIFVAMVFECEKCLLRNYFVQDGNRRERWSLAVVLSASSS